MRRIGILAAVVWMVLAAGPIGCGSKPAQPSQASGKVVVFAAASLKPAFTQVGQQFKAQNPGVSVDFEFAGSSELATQLTQGATADVFASADTAQMVAVGKAGLLAGDPTNFASNTLVIVTAPGNPKRIGSFADLARPGLNVVTCQQPVPCGAAAHRVEDRTGVRLNPVSEEPSVTDALNKVTSGQADAALVYVTDGRNAGAKVATVTFPEAAAAVNVYPIGVLKKAPLAAQAHRFVDLVTSPTGQQILAQAGFAKP
ncbi:molybdate ABC transporter substrate-binding protein [Mycobacterium colombiense]|uniref:Molybdate ABC transporter substrate-binding protein n=1 Tax=Mycobacterium colombiense TaxID=339268 RepID=A0A329K5G7_9MYCO|nr:molybdate ABC transporter substrate-binding protein [Mycobacterium colombiense]RAU90062.1 molybdate ABC transporter substrate-binding protein [Mycobacterium colombiense]